MKKRILKIDVDQHFGNRLVRLCSPAARGFLIDLKALCVPGGELVANDVPLTVKQIASLTGSTVAECNAWFKELAAANAYDTAEDRLYFADMVKDAKFKAGAKVSGARGAAVKKAAKPESVDTGAAVAQETKKVVVHAPPVAAPRAPTKKPAAWWRSPAGWVRKGLEQSVSMKPGEDLVAFQERVARRLPDGDWLDVLPARVAKAIRADIQEHAAKPK